MRLETVEYNQMLTTRTLGASRGLLVVGGLDTLVLCLAILTEIFIDSLPGSDIGLVFLYFQFAPALSIELEFGWAFIALVLAYWAAKGPLLIFVAFRLRRRASKWLRVARAILTLNMLIIGLSILVGNSIFAGEAELLFIAGLPYGLLSVYLWLLNGRGVKNMARGGGE